MIPATLSPQDEELHPVGEGQHWQESWYFNWSDAQHDLFGLARIGFNFSKHKIDGLILTIRQGRPEYIYPAVNIPFRGNWKTQTAAHGLRARQLVFTVEEPMKQWRITLDGRSAMDLVWSSYTPAFDYHASGRDLPANITGRHFEQSGLVSGWTRFKGTRLEINGTGQRDKSWGVRDWARVEGWNWISAQFGPDLTFNIWEGFFEGRRYQNGFVFHNGDNLPIEKISIQFQWDGREHVPSRADIEIFYGKGDRLDVAAHGLGQFPLVKKGLWIQETSARFETHFKGERKKGRGVIEHAWHAGKLGALLRFPDLLQTGSQLLR